VSRGRLALVALAALLAAATARPASAQPAGDEPVVPAIGDDYRIDNARWNGLATLGALAKGLGWRVEQARHLEWSDLGPGDVLLLLYPTQLVDAGDLDTFIRGGGHVVIGDDFGRSEEAFVRLGVRRDEVPSVAAESFYDGLRYAPIARPASSRHPLARGVSELVGNHPSVLHDVRGPEVVFSFGPGEHTVVAGRLGAGRFVVLSDPSMLINRMLEFEGNLGFAINLLRFFEREGETRRLVVLAGDFGLYGRPAPMVSEGGLRGGLSRLLSDLDLWFRDDVNAYVLTEAGARVAALVVGLAIALACLAFLPATRTQVLDGGWTRIDPAAPADDFEAIVASYDRARPRKSFLLPASVIRDTVNARLARILEVREPLYSLRRGELLAELERARGRDAARALDAILPVLRALPTRAQAVSPWESGTLAQAEFERLHDGARALYRTLGES
jgi:hypothetical protein